MNKLSAVTELFDYHVPVEILSPENDMAVLKNAFCFGLLSIGKDNRLYLSYKKEKSNTEFNRIMLYEDVLSFAAVKRRTDDKFIISIIAGGKVYTAITEHPETLAKIDFKVLNIGIMSSAVKLKRLLVSAIDDTITITICGANADGRTETFFAVFNVDNRADISYYPLACNFSEIKAMTVGRAVDQFVDGVYIFGKYGETRQLMYAPVKNVFGSTPPAVVRLKAFDNLSAVCTYNLANTVGTNLIAASDGKLWLYPYSKQVDCFHTSSPDPVLIAESVLLEDVKSIISCIAGNRLEIYVLNSSGTLSCVVADANGEKLENISLPMLVAKDILFFTISENELFICKQDKLLYGKYREEYGTHVFSEIFININTDKCYSFPAYVTRIFVPEKSSEITVKTKNGGVAECYINGVFRSFKTLTAEPDASGAVDIVQNASGLTPYDFDVFCNDLPDNSSDTLSLEPNEKVHQRIMSLKTEDALNNAVITDYHGKQAKLVQNLPDGAVKWAAANISQLSNAVAVNGRLLYSEEQALALKMKNTVVRLENGKVSVIELNGAEPFFLSGSNYSNSFLYSIEEVFNYIRSKFKSFIDTVCDIGVQIINGVWHLVLKIGDEILSCVLDTIKKVLSFAVKILEYIGIVISKIFQWLAEIFDIDGAIEVNRMLKRVFKSSTIIMENMASEAKQGVNTAIDEAIKNISDWSGVSPGFQSGTPDSSAYNTPSATYFADRIFKNLDLFSIDFNLPKMPSDLILAIDNLVVAMKPYNNGTDILTDLVSEIKNITRQNASLENFYNIFKRIIGTAALSALEFVKEITDALFDLAVKGLKYFVTVIDSSIHIPFVSELLKFFGIASFSVLDLVTFPVAFLLNIIHKIISGKSFDVNPINKCLDGLTGVSAVKSVILSETSGEILPTGVKKEAFVGIRSAIAATCFFETTYSAVIYGTKKEPDYFTVSLEAGLSILDFTLSAIAGYEIYSPLDQEKWEAQPLKKDDADALKKASEAAGVYTKMWIIKFFFSIFNSIASIVELKEPNPPAYEALNSLIKPLYVLTVIVGFISECVSIGNANDIDASTNEWKTDKEIFLSDTSGYLLDDVRNVLDVILNSIEIEGIPLYVLIAIRSVFSFGYGFTQGYSACIMNKYNR
jgi:hypothetical protein